MFMKHLAKISALLALLSTMLITSVFASWVYSAYPPTDKDMSFGLSLIEFVYKPEEVLPGHEVGYLDQNHQEVIYNITDHIKYGLNYQDKPLLSNYLNSNGIVYSNQKATGGNLKFLGDESESLMWVVEKDTDTVYYIYTFLDDNVDSSHLNTIITVYKTMCVYKDGLWQNERAFLGQAPIARISGIMTINVNEWKEIQVTSI